MRPRRHRFNNSLATGNSGLYWKLGTDGSAQGRDTCGGPGLEIALLLVILGAFALQLIKLLCDLEEFIFRERPR